MNENIIKAKNLMEQGWKAREDHKFIEAKELLTSAKVLFEQEGDWFNVTECLNHLAYNEKLQGEILLKNGYELAKEAQKIAKDMGTKDVLIKRSLLSMAISLGMYEIAEAYASDFISQMNSQADKADGMVHLALIKLRTGNLTKAKEIIEEARKMLDEKFNETTEPHRYIWKVKVLITQALIALNNNEHSVARAYAEEALKIAQDNKLKTRTDQAEAVLTAIDELSKQ